MAKISGVATQLSGKVGQLIYRQTKYGTVVYEARKTSVPQRTEAQMQVRTQWGNLAAVYKQFNQTLKKGFEGLNGKMHDYNAFIQANTNVVKVYVPKSVRLNGGSVLAPYQITRGTLPSVAMTKGAGGVLVSDVRVGSLVIGAETTVADLANAVIASAAKAAARNVFLLYMAHLLFVFLHREASSPLESDSKNVRGGFAAECGIRPSCYDI